MILCEDVNSNAMVEFGKSWGLHVWDWLALAISVVSIGIAIASMVFAIKTLKSQRKTEKNTQPIINKDIQLMLLNKKLQKLSDYFIYLLALHFCLEKTDYKTYPSNKFWIMFSSNYEDLYESLFYNEYDQFYSFHQLKESYNVFFKSCDNMRSIIENKKANNTNVSNEFKNLYIQIAGILFNFHEVLIKCFCFDNKEALENLKSNFFLYENRSAEFDRLVSDLLMNERPKVYSQYRINIFGDFLLDIISNFTLILSLNSSFRVLDNGESQCKKYDNFAYRIPKFYDNILKQVWSIIYNVIYNDISVLDRCCLSLMENKNFNYAFQLQPKVYPDFEMIDKIEN